MDHGPGSRQNDHMVAFRACEGTAPEEPCELTHLTAPCELRGAMTDVTGHGVDRTHSRSVRHRLVVRIDVDSNSSTVYLGFELSVASRPGCVVRTCT